MLMKVRCEYCGNIYEDTLAQCPQCGAANPVGSQLNENDPKTIDELAKWYSNHNLPPYETTRFFIGEDYKNPKAFGIYQDFNTKEYVVYKNKASGERVERYRGKDERYAVHELFAKLKDEIVNQKYKGNKGYSSNKKRGVLSLFRGNRFFIFVTILIILFTLSKIFPNLSHRGYYRYNNSYYYTVNDDWYEWDEGSDDWFLTSEDWNDDIPAITQDYDAYYISDKWNSSIEAPNWEDSDYAESYIENKNYSHDSSDDGFGWSSGSSWDSGNTDWDSDW